MNRKIALGLGLCAAVAVAIAATENQGPEFPRSTLTIATAAGKSLTFQTEIARSRDQQEYGLMFRKHLADDHGMLFVEQPPTVIHMWMKNTLIPLDMVFVAPGGKIAQVAENAVPESLDIIGADQPVEGVIELAGGAAKRLGIAAGDHVTAPELPH